MTKRYFTVLDDKDEPVAGALMLDDFLKRLAKERGGVVIAPDGRVVYTSSEAAARRTPKGKA